VSNGAAEKPSYPADRRVTNLLRRENRDPVPIIRGFCVSRTESRGMTKERASRAATLRIYRARTSRFTRARDAERHVTPVVSSL